MRKHIVLVGDTTTHGGKVITGSTADTIDGRPMARQGDLVECPLHGIRRIIEGDHATLLDGRPLALEGHLVECGSGLVSSGADAVEKGQIS